MVTTIYPVNQKLKAMKMMQKSSLLGGKWIKSDVFYPLDSV